MNILQEIRTDALVFAFAAVSGAALLAPPVCAEPTTLQAAIADVAQRWPRLRHITPIELVLIADRQGVLFDVRSEAEYRVSHIPGAIHVNPGILLATFLARYGDAVKGKTVVFYCSVGVRSSRLAERVAAGLEARGAEAVYDLAGGIFAWHGEGRALVDASGPTDYVHPYDRAWGRLIARQHLVRTEPGG